jgi:hypothetical protein
MELVGRTNEHGVYGGIHQGGLELDVVVRDTPLACESGSAVESPTDDPLEANRGKAD